MATSSDANSHIRESRSFEILDSTRAPLLRQSRFRSATNLRQPNWFTLFDFAIREQQTGQFASLRSQGQILRLEELAPVPVVFDFERQLVLDWHQDQVPIGKYLGLRLHGGIIEASNNPCDPFWERHGSSYSAIQVHAKFRQKVDVDDVPMTSHIYGRSSQSRMPRGPERHTVTQRVQGA